MISVAAIWLLPVIFAGAVAYWRADLRRQMFWTGLFSLPVLVWPNLLFDLPIAARTYLDLPANLTVALAFFLIKLIAIFAFGALASAVYETAFGRHLRLNRGPRTQLGWLAIGVVIVFLGTLSDPDRLLLWLSMGFVADSIVVIILRPDLVWDALFSSVLIGAFYAILVILIERTAWGALSSGIGSQYSGLTVAGLPVEQVVLSSLFGALWGPIYLAVKDLRTVKE